MSLEKAKIDGAIYDVVSVEEYYKNPDMYGSYTALTWNNDGYVYPIRSKNDNKPGCYMTGGMDFFIKPTEENAYLYSQDNIINFKNASNLKEIIQNQQRLMNDERSVLMTIDNLFDPGLSDNDTPEMKAFKQAIICKGIDIDKYEQRIGPNFNNDKRLMRKDSITFKKLRTLCDALDMKATITIEDASPDVPNPIGKVIEAEITGNNIEMNEED